MRGWVAHMLCVHPLAYLGNYHTRFAQSLEWPDIDATLVILSVTLEWLSAIDLLLAIN